MCQTTVAGSDFGLDAIFGIFLHLHILEMYFCVILTKRLMQTSFTKLCMLFTLVISLIINLSILLQYSIFV